MIRINFKYFESNPKIDILIQLKARLKHTLLDNLNAYSNRVKTHQLTNRKQDNNTLRH